jgi:hypothetical protein
MTRNVTQIALLPILLCIVLLASGNDKAFDRTGLKRAGVDFQSRLVLNRAIANHWRKLPILVLARPKRNEAAARRLLALGGEVHFRSDDIDYLRGTIPTANVHDYFESDDVQEIRLGYFSVGVWDLDKATPPSIPPPPESEEPRSALKPPAIGSEMPLLHAKEMTAENPYLPTRDVGAPQFVSEHPGFDGRGVTIAIMEMGDLDHPTLRTARTIDGTVVPKIAGILNSYDPDHNEMVEAGLPLQKYAGMNEDGSVVRMQTVIQTQGVEFEQHGQRYVAPMVGSYRFGEFQMPRGDSAETRRVGVLWQPQCHCVWVDTNGNHSFADEKPIHNFNETHDLGYFPQSLRIESGAASPNQIVEPAEEGMDARDASMAFAVTIDEVREIVYIYCSDSDHGTMVASIATGKGFLGGEANGVAPESQVIYVRIAGNRVDRFLEGILQAAQDPRVDLITSSQGVAEIPGDGESLLGLAMDRVVARFRKPILQGAGNQQWPGMEQVSGLAAAAGVLGIGGYNQGSTRNALYPGSRFSDSEDYIGWLSANGPSSLGALKPDVLAPSLEVAAMPCALNRRPEPELYVLASFRLPNCYWVGGGTSSAAPFAAGAIALLISAAKQGHIPYDAESLYWATRMGARRLTGYGTYRQGSGLIQIGKSWALLRESRNRPAVRLSFSAPTRSPLVRYLKTQRGVGLYENGGWTVGEQGMRALKILRYGSSDTPLRCRLELLGNDGTFTVPGETDLPAEREVQIPVQIHISAAGVHDAILRIVDSQTGLPLDQVALTIVVGNALGSQNGYAYDFHGVLKPEESQTAFVEVPTGISVLKVQINISKGNVHLFGEAPSFLGGWLPLKQYLYPSHWTHSEPQPEPGVWQFRVDDFEHSYLDWKHFLNDAEYVLHIEAQGSGPNLAMHKGTRKLRPGVETRSGGVQKSASINRRGFLDHVSFASRDRPTIFEMEIPKHTESLYLRFDATEPRDTPDTDLYLYNCAGTEKNHPCKLWNIHNLRGARTSFFVRWPDEGLWRVLVDPLSPKRSVNLQLSKVIVGPGPGKTSLTQAQTQSGDSNANGKTGEPAIVNFVEVIDPASEREEQISPLRDFVRYPNSDFLPVPLSIDFSH